VTQRLFESLGGLIGSHCESCLAVFENVDKELAVLPTLIIVDFLVCTSGAVSCLSVGWVWQVSRLLKETSMKRLEAIWLKLLLTIPLK